MRKRNYTALKNGAIFEDEQEDDTPKALVHNVVATTQIITNINSIDLQYIADVLSNSVYDRRKFAAITIRICDPSCTALLFTSGKIVLTGCKGWHECIAASMHIVHMLRRVTPYVDLRVSGNTIQNVVGHVAIPLPERHILDLDLIYAELCVKCTYQQKLFPGLIFRPDDSPIVLLCFFTGKIVITGGKCIADIVQGWRLLWPTVRRFVRVAPTGHPALTKFLESMSVPHALAAELDIPEDVSENSMSLPFQLASETGTLGEDLSSPEACVTPKSVGVLS